MPRASRKAWTPSLDPHEMQSLARYLPRRDGSEVLLTVSREAMRGVLSQVHGERA